MIPLDLRLRHQDLRRLQRLVHGHRQARQVSLVVWECYRLGDYSLE